MQNSQQNHISLYSLSQASQFCIQKPLFHSQAKTKQFQHQNLDKDEAIKIIFQTYLEKGADWKLMKSLIGEKHFKDPKNFVYNSLRKFSKLLEHFDTETVQQKRKISKKNVIVSLMEVVNHIQKELALINKTLCQEESMLFRIKKRILIYSFWEKTFSNFDVLELLQEIKIANLRLKSLGVFKAKQRRSWKITQKGLKLISSFDSSIKYERNEKGDRMEVAKALEKVDQRERAEIDLSDFYIDQKKYVRNLVEEANMFLGILQKQDDLVQFF